MLKKKANYIHESLLIMQVQIKNAQDIDTP